LSFKIAAPTVPVEPLFARAQDDFCLAALNQYMQAYLPSEALRAINYIPQFPANFLELELFTGTVKHSPLHIIQANLANTKQAGCPPYTLIEDYLFLLEHVMNPRKLTSAVMSPAYAVSQMIPSKKDEIDERCMSIIHHLASFLLALAKTLRAAIVVLSRFLGIRGLLVVRRSITA
jgi:hypothetical protein